MTITPTLAAVVAIGAALGFAASKFNWRKWWYRKDLVFATPITKRKDLYWGYFGCQAEQVAETKGTFNIFMECQFDGEAKANQNILDAATATILDLVPQVWYRATPAAKFVVHPNAYEQLDAFFRMLQSTGALKYVKVLYPIDEPNNTVGDAEEFNKGISLIRAVASKYDELANYKLAVIYAADKPFICMEKFDWIGYDDYDLKSNILTSKQYKNLVASLQPHQQIMLVPGAAYGQDPTPFINYAQASPTVVAILAFLWCDRAFDVGAGGVRSNGMAPTYLAAGRSIIEA
jgi:hypothetical protein